MITVMPCFLGLLKKKKKKSISCLQFLRTGRWEHISPIFKSLLVCFGIDLKVELLVFQCLHVRGSWYLSEPLLPDEPSRALTSSDTGLFNHSKSQDTHSRRGPRSSFTAPVCGKSLPERLRASETLHVLMKTYLSLLFILTSVLIS